MYSLSSFINRYICYSHWTHSSRGVAFGFLTTFHQTVLLCSDSFTGIKSVQVSCVGLPYSLTHLSERLRKIMELERYYNRYSVANSNLDPAEYKVRYEVLLKCMTAMPNPMARRKYH